MVAVLPMATVAICDLIASCAACSACGACKKRPGSFVGHEPETPVGVSFHQHTPRGVNFDSGCKRYAQTLDWYLQESTRI